MGVSFFWRGLLIGLSIAAPVGPIGVLCIRRTLAEGWAAGLVSGLGAATADALYGCIAGFGLAFVSSLLVSQQTWLRLVGGLFLCTLGLKTLLSRPAEQAASARSRDLLGAYASTFLLTLTNPLTILSFAAIFAGLGVGGSGGGYVSAGVLVGGVFTGSALWWLLLSSGVGLLRTRFNARALLWVNRASGVIITACGLWVLSSLMASLWGGCGGPVQPVHSLSGCSTCGYNGAKMSAIVVFDQMLSEPERQLMAQLNSPRHIQTFLDELAYSTEPIYRCPRRVLRERTAHCFDGALFAAAALRCSGYPPLILDMLPNDRDDDHLLALYKVDGHWGAVAKSNFVGLRFREPIHRTLRELVLSYFEQYYNVAGEKTLRGYTLPLNLQRFDRFNWMVSDDHLERIAGRLDEIRRVSLLTEQMKAGLSPVDERLYRAGLAGAVEGGLYQPPRQGREEEQRAT